MKFIVLYMKHLVRWMIVNRYIIAIAMMGCVICFECSLYGVVQVYWSSPWIVLFNRDTEKNRHEWIKLRGLNPSREICTIHGCVLKVLDILRKVQLTRNIVIFGVVKCVWFRNLCWSGVREEPGRGKDVHWAVMDLEDANYRFDSGAMRKVLWLCRCGGDWWVRRRVT